MYHFRDQILSGSPELFFVMNCDVCGDFPLLDMLQFHRGRAENGSHFTILATEVRFPLGGLGFEIRKRHLRNSKRISVALKFVVHCLLYETTTVANAFLDVMPSHTPYLHFETLRNKTWLGTRKCFLAGTRKSTATDIAKSITIGMMR